MTPRARQVWRAGLLALVAAALVVAFVRGRPAGPEAVSVQELAAAVVVTCFTTDVRFVSCRTIER